jgi:hypothetical protein
MLKNPEEKAMDDRINASDRDMRFRSIEERLDRIEAKPQERVLSLHPVWAIALSSVSIVLGCLALGYPEHYYQFLFSAILLFVLYHRGFLRPVRGHWRWPQIVLNYLLLCLFFKFLIGGGVAYPFDWLKLPVITKTPPPADPSWYSSFIPDYTVLWQGIPKLSAWSIDITKIQTIFLLATFAGALFRFEPFTSISAIALLIISVPVLLRYNWDLMVLFLVLGSISLYVQSRVRTSFGIQS